MAMDDQDDQTRLHLAESRTAAFLEVVDDRVREDGTELTIHDMRMRPRYQRLLPEEGAADPRTSSQRRKEEPRMSSVNTSRHLSAGWGRRRELSHIVASLLFLAAGICAVWFVHGVLDVEGDAVLVALLVVPLALYLTLSGRVSEITAGGFSVRLNEARQTPIDRTVVPEDRYVIAELDPPYPIEVKADPNLPTIVTLRHGGGPYERDKALRWLRKITAKSPVPFLVVLDHGRVLAYEREDRGGEFIKLVNAGDPDVFDDGGGFSALRTETVTHKTTNAEALELMERTGLDALVVVDGKGRFAGIVERDRVLSAMMLALVSSPQRM
jgi:hypothetical protein